MRNLTLIMATIILITTVGLGCREAQNCFGRADLIAIIEKIDHLASKGRIQDPEYNPKIQRLIKPIFKNWEAAVPEIIKLTTDNTILDREPVDFWGATTRGDVAVIILLDLFTDQSGNYTLPDLRQEDLFSEDDSSFRAAMNAFILKNGREQLQAKLNEIWNANQAELYFDTKEKCLKLRPKGR